MRSLYLNGQLAAFYGAKERAARTRRSSKVFPEPDARAGVVTHPYLMATFAYTGDHLADPSRRVPGSRSVLGRTRCGPPPEAVAPLAPDLHASLSDPRAGRLADQPERPA